MRRFDYRCANQHVFEHSEPNSETVCPVCGEGAARLWSQAPGVLIRPAGWSLRLGDTGYGHLPTEKRTVNSWQMG
jgi:hypothetical protein